jgi:hypothetical protein
MPQALQQFDQSARAWLIGAEFPCEHGISLVNAIAKTVHQPHKMTPALIALWHWFALHHASRAWVTHRGRASRLGLDGREPPVGRRSRACHATPVPIRPLRPDRLPFSLLRNGAEKLGYELEEWVFPFEGLLLAIFRRDFDSEPRAVLAACPFGT